MFVNFSNHPSENWTDEQMVAARKYGNVVDALFPMVEAASGVDKISLMGDECVDVILKYKPDMVMCQGEFNLCIYVIKKLIEMGIKCCYACSERISHEEVLSDGTVTNISSFRFEQFREYEMMAE